MTVADRYTQNNEKEVKNCPSCKAEDVDFITIQHGKKVCNECIEEMPELGLGELTDKYIREGLSEDDAFRQAKEDKGVILK